MSRISSSLYAVEIRFYDPNCGHNRVSLCSDFVPCFLPDNSVIHSVSAPFMVEFPLCLSGQQFNAND